MFTAKAEELKTYPFTLPKVDEAEAGKCADKDAATTCFVDGNTLQPVKAWDESNYIVGCITVYCGEVRLIDNIKYKG